MKKVILRLFAYLGALAVISFVVLFVWANWRPLSPGEKQSPVNFVTYDVSHVKSPETISKICSDLKAMDGVGGTNNVPVMKAIIVNYKIFDITEEEILDYVKDEYNVSLSRKKFDQNGKQCPMAGTLSTVGKIRRALNIRG